MEYIFFIETEFDNLIANASEPLEYCVTKKRY